MVTAAKAAVATYTETFGVKSCKRGEVLKKTRLLIEIGADGNYYVYERLTYGNNPKVHTRRNIFPSRRN